MNEAPRNTRQRRAVKEVLDSLDGFHSAQEIHEILVEGGESIGLSTIYRNLQILTEAEEVDVVRSDEGETLYRRCSTGHHHHLVCRSCGHAVEVEGPGIEVWAKKIAAEHDFSDISHTFEIFGVCKKCEASSD